MTLRRLLALVLVSSGCTRPVPPPGQDKCRPIEAHVEFTSEAWAEYAERVGVRTSWKVELEHRPPEDLDCQQPTVRCSTEAECIKSGDEIWSCELWDQIDGVPAGLLAPRARIDATPREEPAFEAEWKQWQTEMRRYVPDEQALVQLIAKHDVFRKPYVGRLVDEEMAPRLYKLPADQGMGTLVSAGTPAARHALRRDPERLARWARARFEAYARAPEVPHGEVNGLWSTIDAIPEVRPWLEPTIQELADRRYAGRWQRVWLRDEAARRLGRSFVTERRADDKLCPGTLVPAIGDNASDTRT